MYKDYYHLKALPFNMTPDPRFFFSSEGHSKALSYLQYGMTKGEGFIVITGDIGTGKTIIVKNLLNELDQDSYISRQLVTTYLDESDLIEMVCESFDIDTQGLSKAGLLNQLKKFLVNAYNSNKHVLLVVDEIQNLPLKTVEELRMLSNFQINDIPLIQSFLVGQKEFIQILQNDQMEQLRQRVTASTHLGPLKKDETEEYINYRLLVAGWKGIGLLFDHEACSLIHDMTEGVPRRINVFCDRIMLYGFLEEVKRFGVQHIEAVAEELSNEITSPVKKDFFNNRINKNSSVNIAVAEQEIPVLQPNEHSDMEEHNSKKVSIKDNILTEENKVDSAILSKSIESSPTVEVKTPEVKIRTPEVEVKSVEISNIDIDIDSFKSELENMSYKLENQLDDMLKKLKK